MVRIDRTGRHSTRRGRAAQHATRARPESGVQGSHASLTSTLSPSSSSGTRAAAYGPVVHAVLKSLLDAAPFARAMPPLAPGSNVKFNFALSSTLSHSVELEPSLSQSMLGL
jgi:hypothetical protein